jgi:hypothetical protein
MLIKQWGMFYHWTTELMDRIYFKANCYFSCIWKSKTFLQQYVWRVHINSLIFHCFTNLYSGALGRHCYHWTSVDNTSEIWNREHFYGSNVHPYLAVSELNGASLQRLRVILRALLYVGGKRRWFSENVTPTEQRFNCGANANQDHKTLKILFIQTSGEPHVSIDSSNDIEFWTKWTML